MPRRAPTKPSPDPAGAAAPTGGPVEFPGGLEGRRMALGAAAVLVLAHGINSFVGGPSFVASALFWLLGAGIVTAVFLRATRADSDRAIWVLAAIAFAAWLAGSAYYAGLDRGADSLSSFLEGDLVLLCFGAAAAIALGRLVPARVVDFQPTILLDGTIVALATAALGAALMSGTLSRLTVEAHPGTMKLAYPIGALLLLSLAVWVVALSDWRP